ncbi:MAG: glycosyltransferase [Candidatus Omnitrophota bacterium]|nr:MAG: glycosyltransferase [Candidatus Omnitrophota bacterium]
MSAESKRIIIFYINEYGGHSRAALNIKEAFEYRHSTLEVLGINGLGYFYPRGEKIVDFAYSTVIKHIPSFWGRIYDRKRVIKKLTPLQAVVNRVAFRKLNLLIKRFSPSCFVATQAFPCGVVADFKEKYGLKIPLIAVVTDYLPHRFWIHPGVDKYVVACHEAKNILVREGVKEEKINILGIPISVKFSHSFLRKEIAKELGLVADIPSVLVMGGGWGLGPLEEVAKHLDDLEQNLQIITVCGRNKKAYDWLVNNRHEFKKPIFSFGYIDYVNKLMDFSDIIITKAGGITVSEALAKGLAMIITNPIPGQEERNVNYLLQKEAIMKVDGASQIKEAVKVLMEDKKSMYHLKERAKHISFIDSSLRIVDLVLKTMS